jgi:hypothetical protein
VASSTSAFADFAESAAAPVAPVPLVQPVPEVAVDRAPTTDEVTREPQATPPGDCARFPADCAEIPEPPVTPEADNDRVQSCLLAGPHNPQGTTSIVPDADPGDGAAQTLRFRVEVEDGLSIDADCLAATITAVLTDERGWAGEGSVHFARVDDDSFDFRLILASPETTNHLCYPAATGGKYSCRNQDKVVLNLMRWTTGTEEFNGDLDTYRQYLINHEVGHLLGRGHRSCREADTPAPVMMQQTKGLGECLPNGWPNENER